MEQIAANDEIVAFIDNQAKQPFDFEDYTVYYPTYIHKLTFDRIIIMSGYFREIREQLLELGVVASKICYWEEYVALKTHGKFKICTKNPKLYGKKNILMITTSFDYNGGSIAIVYAAKYMMQCGYAVCVAIPDGNERFISETIDDGLNIIIIPSIPYLGTEEFFLISQFDIVMVNVFQMIQCACEISKCKPVLWWVHEPSEFYDNIKYKFAKYDDIELMKKIKIYAVSEIAKRNFEFHYPKMACNILPYGLPDEATGETTKCDRTHKFVFAIIGAVTRIKAQEVFLKAIRLLPLPQRMYAEFWVIGNCGNDSYGLNIRAMAETMPEVKLLGVLTRERIRRLFSEISVVICSSLEETMSMTITEGLMHGKVCITTDTTGIASYIKDGENGFVCKAGSPEALCEKMNYIMQHKEECQTLGKNARKTYEKFFSMKAFGERLEKAILKTAQAYTEIKP